MNKNENSSLKENEINGLIYIDNFISQEEEKELLQEINKKPWSKDLQRRVQHYGFKYDYKSRTINSENFLGKLPSFCDNLLEKIRKIIDKEYDQLIINEYLPGQGISPHVDKIEFFEDGIISISLGSDCVMNFTNVHEKNKVKNVHLKRRSLICLTGESRYQWKHSIAQKKYDIIKGKKVRRDTRVSLTFRKVKGVKLKSNQQNEEIESAKNN